MSDLTELEQQQRGLAMSDLTELEQQIGRRGTATISSDNRGLVRRWLCIKGVQSKSARTLTLSQLREAYNDISDTTVLEISNVRTYSADSQNDSDQQQPQHGDDQTMTQTQTTPAKPQNSKTAAITRAIEEALGGFSDGPSLDEAQIIALIKQHAPATRIEITNAGETRKIEGLHHYATKYVTRYLSSGLHVWLAGPAGSGKTSMAIMAAKALDRKFYSTGSVQSEFRLTGFIDAKGEVVRTPFREAFEHGGVFLWDEIDGSNPNALIAFNQALENGVFAFPDGMVEKHPDCVCIAAANTWGAGATAEYVGRTRIDGATVDRFVQVAVDYDEKMELAMAGADFEDWAKEVQKYRKNARAAGVRAIISTRAIIKGMTIMRDGGDKKEAIAGLIRRGMDDATWAKVAA
jgi:MoxR-like ATPase